MIESNSRREVAGVGKATYYCHALEESGFQIFLFKFNIHFNMGATHSN